MTQSTWNLITLSYRSCCRLKYDILLQWLRIGVGIEKGIHQNPCPMRLHNIPILKLSSTSRRTVSFRIKLLFNAKGITLPEQRGLTNTFIVPSKHFIGRMTFSTFENLLMVLHVGLPALKLSQSPNARHNQM